MRDGDGALERFKGEAAGVKGGGAVRRADGNEYAGFTDLEAAEPVDHGNAMDTVSFAEVIADFAHFGESHGFVGFIIEIQSRAIVGLIAHETVEGDDGAVFGGADVAGQRGQITRRVVELGESHPRRGRVRYSADAHATTGKKSCHLWRGPWHRGER